MAIGIPDSVNHEGAVEMAVIKRDSHKRNEEPKSDVNDEVVRGDKVYLRKYNELKRVLGLSGVSHEEAIRIAKDKPLA